MVLRTKSVVASEHPSGQRPEPLFATHSDAGLGVTAGSTGSSSRVFRRFSYRQAYPYIAPIKLRHRPVHQ
ncbi:MAG: hypothetical protein ACREBC_31845, partial [Pyrinomonadaceae bacterium]